MHVSAEGGARLGIALGVADQVHPICCHVYNCAALHSAHQVIMAAAEGVHQPRQLPAARLGHAIGQLHSTASSASAARLSPHVYVVLS
jgi:hypothetical protein